MEGYSVASQEQSYDEFNLDSADDLNEGGIANLEEKPVAKILLPSFNQKKPTTIKINLQNPTFSKKTFPDIVKEKESSPEAVSESNNAPVEVISVTDAKKVVPLPKFNIKNIDKEDELYRLFRLKFPTPERPFGSLFVRENTRLGFRIACKACNIHCTSDNDLICHANGKKHLALLAQLEEKMANSEMRLAPGEPVPPGFEDEVQRVPVCQTALDEFGSSAMIGLEYLVELTSEEDDTGQFVCFLCDKKGENKQNRQNIIPHFITTSHRLGYIKKHFPSAYEAISKTANDRDRKTEKGALARLVAANIETDFGRLKPIAVDKLVFEFRKEHVREQIENDKHFSETPEKTYVELVNPMQEKSSSSKYDHRKYEADSKDQKAKDGIEAFRKNLLSDGSKNDGDSPTLLEGGKRQSRDSPNDDIIELSPSKKKVKIDDLLRDTTPISLSSDSLSLSSSSRSHSRSPGRKSRRPNDRYNDRHNRPGYPENIMSRRDRYDQNDHRDRHQMNRRRSRSPPRYRRSRSPRFNRSRSPNVYRRHRSRSPRPLRRSNSPKVKGSRSPSNHSKSPSLSRSHSSQDTRQRPGQHPGRSRHDKSPDEEKPLSMRDKWDKFREEADAIEIEMQKQREFHQKNPEKHPLYGEEWKKFWNARYKEVQSEGKDPTKYDFKPEWVMYWNSKVVELLDIEFKVQKDALKKKYELIGEEEQQYHYHPKQQSQQQNFKQRTRGARPGDDDKNYGYAGRERDYNNRAGGSVSDVKDTWKALTGGEIHEPYTGPPREATWDPPPQHRPSYNREPVTITREVRVYDKEDSASVVAVLRLLTALESQLGSFGPKVNTLLAEAISLDKIKAGSSDSLAGNMENIVLFETVREKFKGQLMAGIVEHYNQKAVRMAICDLTVLLNKAPPPTQVVAPVATTVTSHAVPSTSAVEVPGVGAVDKLAIAQQIAEALIAQGRTDVSEAELEQLVDAVVGMAKQTAESNKPVSTASFVKQMDEQMANNQRSAQKPTENSSVKEKSSNSALKALQTAYRHQSPKKQEQPVSSYTGFNLTNVAEISDLPEADLKSCLRIFQHLSTNEQRSLVMYLKKLEDTDPQRVEKLRKYVNLGAGDVVGDDDDKPEPKAWESRPSSPFSARGGGANPYMNETRRGEDSDEEYSFEDVYKAAARNVEKASKKALEEAEKKKTEETKLKILTKPADNNAIKQAIEATTDNMMASLRDSLTQRKDSPLNTSQSNTSTNNQAPFVIPSNKPPGLPPSEITTVSSAVSVNNTTPTQAMQDQANYQSMDYNNMGYSAAPGNSNYMTQDVAYPPQQYAPIQYPPPQGQQYNNFGSESYYQYQQPQDNTYGQQYMSQQPTMQPAMPPQAQQAFAQPEVNPYHPAQYSATYEKRQKKNQQSKRW